MFFTVEHGRNRCAQLFNECQHVLAQRGGLSDGQLQGLGAMGLRKIIDVTPIAARTFPCGTLLQQCQHKGALAYSGGPQGKQVIPPAMHANSELHRLTRPVLAQYMRQIL